MHKVAVLTGKRGGFGAMKPLLKKLALSQTIKFELYVTDQHLDPQFGSTLTEVKKEFQSVIEIPMTIQDGSRKQRASALSTFALNMNLYMAENRPDLLLLYGDRGEVLQAAAVATTLNIPIAHLQGGDLTGSTDEVVRHAVTKLSHLHFASNQQSALRIIRMGENPANVFCVGDNHIDEIVNKHYTDGIEVKEKLGLDLRKPIAIVLQHSETTEPERSGDQFFETLKALKKFDLQKVFIYPCSDPGFKEIIDLIEKHRGIPDVYIYKNLEASQFWGLLSVASVLIGNSSCGIVESTYFNLPAVNIGRRQLGRLASDNVIDVPHNEYDITKAIALALTENFQRRCLSAERLYGNGTAAEQIYEKIVERLNKGISLEKTFYET